MCFLVDLNPCTILFAYGKMCTYDLMHFHFSTLELRDENNRELKDGSTAAKSSAAAAHLEIQRLQESVARMKSQVVQIVDTSIEQCWKSHCITLVNTIIIHNDSWNEKMKH